MTEYSAHPSFDTFVETIAALRAPDGCPWDREQTHESIAKNMIEEAFEATSAIEEGDVVHIREELGDVLLQVVLQSQIAADAGEFTIDDVINDVNAKIVRRHPHVFGAQEAFLAAGLDPQQIEEAQDPEKVLDLWDVIKQHERAMKAQAYAKKLEDAGLDPAMPRGLLEDVSKEQPSLMQAQELSKKTIKVGFEWEDVQDVWAKVYEEIAEYGDEAKGSPEAQLEFGDVLFTLVNVALKDGIDAETALRRTCDKFRTRWQTMEQRAYAAGKSIESMSTEDLEALWMQAKEAEHASSEVEQ